MTAVTTDDLKAILDALAAMNAKLTSLDNKVAALEDKVTSMDVKVTSMDVKVTSMDVKLTALDVKVTNIDHRLQASVAKAKNAMLGRSDIINKVFLDDGTIPDVDYPLTISQLAVSGSESLPDGSGVNTWNSAKSKRFLSAFKEDDTDTDTESAQSEEIRAKTALRRRVKVANILGISTTQLNFAHLIG
jgi:uncharacterized coiled-coil protein SlyX